MDPTNSNEDLISNNFDDGIIWNSFV
jgi:hypothetical protein